MHLKRVAKDGEDDNADPSKANEQTCTRVHGDDVVSYVTAKAEISKHAYNQVNDPASADGRPNGSIDPPLYIVKELVVDGKHVLCASESKHKDGEDADRVSRDGDEFNLALWWEGSFGVRAEAVVQNYDDEIEDGEQAEVGCMP